MVSAWICNEFECPDFQFNCSFAKNRRGSTSHGWSGAAEFPHITAKKYWGFVGGFFVFHCVCAMFEQDDERLDDAQKHLSIACSNLGLGAEFHEQLCFSKGEPLPASGFSFRRLLAQNLRQMVGEPAEWIVESGYLFGLTFASLVGQANSNTPGDVLMNLKVVAGVLPTMMRSVQNAGLPNYFREALLSVQRELEKTKDKSSAAKCRDVLAPIITKFLLKESKGNVVRKCRN